MYKPINGWTRAKILRVLKNRKFDEASRCESSGACVYRAENGNRCAIGMFIPNNHKGLGFEGLASELLETFPSLAKRMPLSVKALDKFQESHDSPMNRKNAKQAMISWVKKNVSKET